MTATLPNGLFKDHSALQADEIRDPSQIVPGGFGNRAAKIQVNPFVSEAIVACKKCGQTNRVYKRVYRCAQKQTQRCGLCRASLSDPFTPFQRSGLLQNNPVWSAAFIALLSLGVFSHSARDQAGFSSSAARPLHNGVVLSRSCFHGVGKLTVRNRAAHDAVVKLVSSRGVVAASFYVSAGNEASLSDIAEGAYSVLFATGSGWDAQLERFTRETTYSRLQRSFLFPHHSSRAGRSIPTVQKAFALTLNSASDGNVEAKEISEADFRIPADLAALL